MDKCKDKCDKSCFRSCYPLLSPSSFYSSEVKVYTGKDLPPVVVAVGGGGQEEYATQGPQFRPSKPSAVIQQASYMHIRGVMIPVLDPDH